MSNVELLVGGYTNDNYALTYRDADYVLRLARRSPLVIDRAFEKRLLSGPIALLTAPLVAYVLPEGHMLTRRVAGPLLVDTRPTSTALAQYLARLHLRIPPLGRRYDLVQTIGRDLRVAAQLGENPPAWFAKEHESLTRAALQIRPCHNDLNPWNVIVSACGPDAMVHARLGDRRRQRSVVRSDLSERRSRLVARGNRRADRRVSGTDRISRARQRLRNAAPSAKRISCASTRGRLAQLASGNRRAEIEAQLARSAEALKEISG